MGTLWARNSISTNLPDVETYKCLTKLMVVSNETEIKREHPRDLLDFNTIDNHPSNDTEGLVIPGWDF